MAIIIGIALYIIYSVFGSPFEIREYPITVSVNQQGIHKQLTLYENGSGLLEIPHHEHYSGGNYYGEWWIQQKKASEIWYNFEYIDNMDRQMYEQFILYPHHYAEWVSGWGVPNVPAHWDYTKFVK